MYKIVGNNKKKSKKNYFGESRGNTVSLNMLARAPEAQNMLINFYDKHKLYEMTGGHEEGSRSELATIMNELLSLDVKQNEKEIITEALLSVISQAERNLRLAISQKMSVSNSAPLRLILNLVSDDIDIATPVLKHSPVLNDTDLLYIVKAQSKEYWRVIAEREGLSGIVIDALADTRDVMTAKTLVHNRNSTLTEHALRVFSVMAEEYEPLTKPLLQRNEMTKELIKEIYSFVGFELKNYITANFDVNVSDSFDIALEEVKTEIIENIYSEFNVTHSMIEEAETLCRNDMLSIHEMVNYLKRGQVSTYIACFTVYCGLSLDTAEKMLKQDKGQGLAIVSKAMDIQKTDFINMFLLTSKLRDNNIVQHSQLAHAIKYFETIEKSMAEEILASSRH